TSTTRSCRSAPPCSRHWPNGPCRFDSRSHEERFPRRKPMKFKTTLLATALALGCGLAQAVTLRVADAGDVQSMDPHSLNETLQLSFTASVYESLVGRNKDMSLKPLLATKWSQASPTVWRFELRRGVKFHDGTPFDADDVVFSFK